MTSTFDNHPVLYDDVQALLRDMQTMNTLTRFLMSFPPEDTLTESIAFLMKCQYAFIETAKKDVEQIERKGAGHE